MNTNLAEERRGILKYMLYHYEVQNKETVWVLNYLKDHPAIKYSRFSSPDYYQKGLTITDNFNLFFKYNDLIVTEADVIFNLINEIDEPFYIYTTFNDEKINHIREYEWLIDKLDNRVIVDDIQLKPNMLNAFKSIIETRIDLALVMNEKEDFHYYSTLLRKVEEK